MTEDNKVVPSPQTGRFKRFYKSFWGEVLQILLFAAIIVIPFRLYIAQPFLVSGPSMDDTFRDGQYLIVDELTYHRRDPLRGEVVIFKYPLDIKKYFIKRIIGLPNETVEIKNGEIKIYNQENPTGLSLNEKYIKVSASDLPRPDTKVSLAADEYYVMGDNRAVSSDSRIWGPVKRDLITGRPFLRLLPLDKIATWPGQVTEI